MKNIEIIGALHFNPLPGFEGFTSLVEIYKKAEIDCENFVNGGIKSIIIENNYDLPHKINVGAETVASMTWLGAKLKQRFPKITFGVSVLWNDYRAAFSIAKAINAKFIRIPVFVDSVITDFGEINAINTIPAKIVSTCLKNSAIVIVNVSLSWLMSAETWLCSLPTLFLS